MRTPRGPRRATRRTASLAVPLDQLAAARERMPMVRVERDYQFEGPTWPVSLLDLLEGRRQLILYRFFVEEGVGGWPDAGCVGCSSWADEVAGLGLLHARDVTFAMSSPAPQPALEADAERMGWYRTHFLQNGPMVSSIGSITSLLALTPYGGQIEGEDVPDGWPQETFSCWMRRHDELDGPPPSART